MKKGFKKLFFTIILFTIILIIFEVLTRIVINFSPFLLNLNPPIMIEDDLLEHFHIPGIQTISQSPHGEYKVKVKINRNGLRDKKIPIRKGNTEKRILILGDSFPEGIHVELMETYPKVLEQELKSKGYNNFTVINAGVAGYSTIHEYLLLKNKGLDYNPDIVILSFFMNDVSENHRFMDIFEINKNGEPVKVIQTTSKTKIIPKPIKYFLKRYSRLMVVFSKLYYLIRGSKQEELNPSRIGDLDFDRFAILRKKYSNNYSEDWEFTSSLILKTQKLCSLKEIEFILLIIPAGVQLNNSEWENVNKFEHLSHESVNNYPQEYLKDFCKRNDIRCLDLLPGLQKHKDGSLYFPYNGHFNCKGHKAASILILNYLENQGLL